MQNLPQERQPFVSLIYLLLLVLAGSMIFTVLAFIIGFFIYGTSVISNSADLLSSNSSNIGFIKIVQIFSTIGMFIFPSLVLARLESNTPASFLRLNTPIKPIYIFLAIAIMIVSTPFLEWTISLNKQMHLPSFLLGIENWMKQQEDQLGKLTLKLLTMNSIPDLLVNLLMIAIIPALGEELIFRGCLQKILISWVKNYHVGIWLAAIIFSAIHMQFYGFLPRMLLGALFGYLFFWSKNLWVPILAHFINNGAAVVFAYVYQQRGEGLEQINESSYSSNLFVCLFSFVLTGLLISVFKNKAMELDSNNTYYGKRLE